MHLTRTFSAEQYERGLESWGFVDLSGKSPLFTSPFGDVFFRADDGFWWLDTLEGQLTRPWSSTEEMRAALDTPEGQDEYLLAGFALAANARGVVPGTGQVYVFASPPILGGPLDVDNITVMDFVVALHLAGQLHDQVRDLPPGTPISGFTIRDD
jgi:hypothetical protein